jgi:hypothetical protein
MVTRKGRKSWEKTDIPCPKPVISYTRSEVGVDLADHENITELAIHLDGGDMSSMLF